jgi:hypothetical protein
VTLPAPEDHYQARVKGGVGEITVKIASGADLDLEVGGGVGELHVELPPDAAVRLRAHTGIGEVKVPRRLTRIEGSGQPFGGSGVWETADYASAARKITIEAQGGVGELHFS